MNQDFLTVKEVAEALRVGQLTIYRYIAAKKLPAYKFGRDFRVSHKDLEAFIASRKVGE